MLGWQALRSLETLPMTDASTRVPWDSMRKTALVAGVLYLLTFISSIPAVFLQSPVLNDPNFIIGSVGADTGPPRRPLRHRQ